MKKSLKRFFLLGAGIAAVGAAATQIPKVKKAITELVNEKKISPLHGDELKKELIKELEKMDKGIKKVVKKMKTSSKKPVKKTVKKPVVKKAVKKPVKKTVKKK